MTQSGTSERALTPWTAPQGERIWLRQRVGGEPFSLRFVYLHLIGEYALHNGHADLVRQCLDGVTGA